MYVLRPPAPALRDHVEHYWFVHDREGEPSDLRVEVFVDGRADLVLNFGVPYRREVIGGEAQEVARSNLDAQRVDPVRIVQRGVVRITGVRFRVGGLGAFAPGPLRRWTGLTPEPAQVLGPGMLPLEEALAATLDADAHAALLDRFFLAALREDEALGVARRCLARLEETRGAVTVAELAGAEALTPRHVERIFARRVGIPPKTMGRIARFQSALRMLMSDPGVSLAEVAATAGYFDQPHFVREFRRMTGGIPRGYRGYYPPEGPSDFAPNVVAFVQDEA